MIMNRNRQSLLRSLLTNHIFVENFFNLRRFGNDKLTVLFSVAVLFFGEQMEEREPLLRARIKVSPQMLKAIALLTTKHVKEYEAAVGPITLPDQVYAAWELDVAEEGAHAPAAG